MKNTKEFISAYRPGEFDHARKKVIEYLNGSGGYVFFGVEVNSIIKQNGQFIGIAFNQELRYNFLRTILREIAIKIFPTDG